MPCRLGLKKFFRQVENSNILNMIFLCDLTNIYEQIIPENLRTNISCDCGGIPFWIMDCCECKDRCQDCCCCQENCYTKFCRMWYIFWSSFCCVLLTPFCFCCFCDTLCAEGEVNELYQNSEDFCYCYKVQRKTSWFCDLLFKNNLLEIIVINIYLELLVVGFGKQIGINLQNNDLNDNFIIIIIYILSFLIIALLNKCKCFEADEKIFNGELYKLSGITILNSFIVTIISGFSLFGNDDLRNFTDKYLIIFPYALTKFYYFILMNSLVKDLDSDNLDLLSNSTIISLFLMIFNIIIWVFTDFIDISIYTLYFFQFIFGIIVALFTLSVFYFRALYMIFIFLTCLWIILLCDSCFGKKREKRKKKRYKFFFQKSDSSQENKK